MEVKMSGNSIFLSKKMKRLFLSFLLFTLSSSLLFTQSLDIPASEWGISFGNSKRFTGLRINFRDRNVQEIKGINVTLWTPKHNEQAKVTGISLGILPGGGDMRGLNLGIAGVGADKKLCGISLGLLGAGSGGDISGVAIGGLGAGSGGDITGIVIGGLGAGSGGNIKGIILGGLGAGAGENMSGFGMGLLGIGAGDDISGIFIGGLGVGAGGNGKGILIGGVGAGTGDNFSGFGFGLVGMGCGDHLQGIAIGGIGAGAPKVTGLAIGGVGVGGKEFTGAAFAIGTVRIENNGVFKGGALSAFNQIKGRQNGITFGIVNYAYELHGIQIGLINYVRDNPLLLKMMPLINFNFSN
jgi:hypothetical protein